MRQRKRGLRNDPEGVAFEYDVLDESRPTFQAKNIQAPLLMASPTAIPIIT
jgi:hypothetical protein